jgi:hypothetical protein
MLETSDLALVHNISCRNVTTKCYYEITKNYLEVCYLFYRQGTVTVFVPSGHCKIGTRQRTHFATTSEGWVVVEIASTTKYFSKQF